MEIIHSRASNGTGLIMEKYSGRLAIQQRIIPSYRASFFDRLAQKCEKGLSVFAGQPLKSENVSTTHDLEKAEYFQTRNLHLFNPHSINYLCWQVRIVKWLKEYNPDALIIEANPRYLSNRQVVRIMHNKGRLVIGWGLGAPTVIGKFVQLRRKMRIRLLSSLDGVIAYSSIGAAQYREWIG